MRGRGGGQWKFRVAEPRSAEIEDGQRKLTELFEAVNAWFV